MLKEVLKVLGPILFSGVLLAYINSYEGIWRSSSIHEDNNLKFKIYKVKTSEKPNWNQYRFTLRRISERCPAIKKIRIEKPGDVDFITSGAITLFSNINTEEEMKLEAKLSHGTFEFTAVLDGSSKDLIMDSDFQFMTQAVDSKNIYNISKAGFITKILINKEIYIIGALMVLYLVAYMNTIIRIIKRRKKVGFKPHILVVLVLCLVSISARMMDSPIPSGLLVSKVSNSNGDPLENSEIEVQKNLNYVNNCTTKKDGQCEISLNAPNEYDVTAEKEGYMKEKQIAKISEGSTTKLEFVLLTTLEYQQQITQLSNRIKQGDYKQAKIILRKLRRISNAYDPDDPQFEELRELEKSIPDR